METTTTPSDEKKILIHLTDRPPVRVRASLWPIIAEARGCDNQYYFQAFRKWWITVRRHADGRTIVYGSYETAWAHERDRTAGQMLAGYDGPAVARAISAVARALGVEELAQSCIDDLPADEIDDGTAPGVALHSVSTEALVAELRRRGIDSTAPGA